jgi:hypothetical protein
MDVHRDLAAVQSGGNAPSAADVRRRDRGGQAIGCCVRPLDCLIEVLVGDDRSGRAELFLVNDPGAVGDPGEDGGCEEVAGPVQRAAAGCGHGSVCKRVADQFADPIELWLVVDRSQLDIKLSAVADPRGLRPGDTRTSPRAGVLCDPRGEVHRSSVVIALLEEDRSGVQPNVSGRHAGGRYAVYQLEGRYHAGSRSRKYTITPSPNHFTGRPPLSSVLVPIPTHMPNSPVVEDGPRPLARTGS